MNYLFQIAPKDGTVFATVQNPNPFVPLFGEPQAQVDALKFTYACAGHRQRYFFVETGNAWPHSINAGSAPLHCMGRCVKTANPRRASPDGSRAQVVSGDVS